MNLKEVKEIKNILESLDIESLLQIALEVQRLVAKQEAEKKREKANV